ncbi:hypothetical protein ALC57_08624, partial [Trachymyrmex cornetzi]
QFNFTYFSHLKEDHSSKKGIGTCLMLRTYSLNFQLLCHFFQNERIAILCHQQEQFLMSLIAQQILKDRCPPLHLPPGVFPDSSRNVRPS